MTPEGKVKELVKRALDALPFYRFMPVQNGMGAPGLDFYGCSAGRFVAIETKTPGKHLTPRQKSTADQIVDAGGVVFVVRDQADVRDMVMLLLTVVPWAKGFIKDRLCP